MWAPGDGFLILGVVLWLLAGRMHNFPAMFNDKTVISNHMEPMAANPSFSGRFYNNRFPGHEPFLW